MAAVSADERRRPHQRAARHGARAPQRRARRRRRPRRTCCGPRARCSRSPSRAASPSWRWPRSARCTGWRCSSRPRPAGRGTRSAPALLAMVGLLLAARLSGATRWAAVAVISLLAILLAFMAGGISAELLRPANWDVLATGIQRGIGDLPGARVPYRGIDQWIRLVIPLGGTMLVVLAALTAFWPRRSATGFPIAALVMLVTLYAVPAVALDFEGEFLRGALLAILVLALPAAGAAAAHRGRRGRAARARRRGRRADHRARDRRRLAVVGLRVMGARHRLLALDLVLLEPRLRPARLAARRPRDAAREGQAARLLEGREPRRVRRRALEASRSPARARTSTSSSRPCPPSASASPSASRSTSATCARARS